MHRRESYIPSLSSLIILSQKACSHMNFPGQSNQHKENSVSQNSTKPHQNNRMWITWVPDGGVAGEFLTPEISAWTWIIARISWQRKFVLKFSEEETRLNSWTETTPSFHESKLSIPGRTHWLEHLRLLQSGKVQLILYLRAPVSLVYWQTAQTCFQDAKG